MSGHSKWSTIKRKKEKTDSQRAKIFTKIGKEIMVAVKEGGADPSNNSKLRDLIAKAKSNNVPNDNINRIIDKAKGNTEKNLYETILYEGYGPSGIAVMVECLTDNRNRTASDVRHYFDKFGGNLGTTGCVSFIFERKGLLVIENKDIKEEDIMNDCMEYGADDFNYTDDFIEIFITPNQFTKVREEFEKNGYIFISAKLEYIPNTYAKIDTEENKIKMKRLLDHLEDNDDVQDVWYNLENIDDLD